MSTKSASKKYPTLKESIQFIDAFFGSVSDDEIIDLYQQHKGCPPSEEQLTYYHHFIEGIKGELPNCFITVNFEKVDYIPIGWTQLFSKLLEVKNA